LCECINSYPLKHFTLPLQSIKQNIIQAMVSTKLIAKTASALLFGGMLLVQSNVSGQAKNTKYSFKDIKKIEATSVKDQYHSGTCWCFSTNSFLESELLRMGKGDYNLSEMYFVRMDWKEKAIRYVQMHGHISWGQGGEFHDVLRIFKEYGAMPQSEYPGKQELKDKYKLNELEAVLKGMLDAIIRNPDGHLSPYWKDAVDGVLDAYFGKVHETFQYKNVTYTPKTFAASLGIDPDDYIEVTSVTNHPYYTQFVNEIEDNWHADPIYNVSLEDLKEVFNNSIDKGYTIAWGADVSDHGFSFAKGIAILPDVDWDTVPKDKVDSILTNPAKQKVVTPEWRQQELDNYNTTDDHGMQITGIAEDQLGDKFYLVKNSWGANRNDNKGYFYASEAYVLAKTTGIMVNKKALPKSMGRKMGI
jgi:bleomycin hydrolase